MTTAVLVSTVSLEVWNSVESCALVVAASVPSIRTMIIVMGTRIKEWTTALFSTRQTTDNSAKKQPESRFSEGTSFGKRKVYIQSAESEQISGADYQPLVD